MEEPRRLPKDIFCTCLFLIAIVVFVIISCFAFSYGDPSTLTLPPFEEIEDEVYTFDIQEFQILKHDINWILLSVVFSMVLSVVWFFVVKRLTAVIIYAFAMVGIFIISMLGYFFYSMSKKYGSFELVLLAAVCWIVSLVLVVALLMFREKILFTSKLAHVAGGVLQRNLKLLVFCLVISLIFLALVFWTLEVILYLYSIPSQETTTLFPVTASGDVMVIYDGNARILAWVVALLALWFSRFLTCLETYVVASVSMNEINAESKGSRDNSPIISALTNAIVYDFGSIAFAASVKWILSALTIIVRRKRETMESSCICCSTFFLKLFTILVDQIVDFSLIFLSFNPIGFWKAVKKVSKVLSNEAANAIFSKIIIHYILLCGIIAFTGFVTFVTTWSIEFGHGHFGVFVPVVILLISYFVLNVASYAYTSTINTVLLVLFLDKGKEQQRLPLELTNFLSPD
jgi:Plasma-membrane choline transporter